MRAFVVSDIHGMYEPFQEILKHWNRSDKLVILGDMVDRGKHSYEVVKTVMDLEKEHDVAYLKGNHEDMLLNYLESPYENGELYYVNGGGETIYSFTGDSETYRKGYKTRAENMLRKHPEEVKFLRSGKLFYQFGKVLFTHAGFCSFIGDWRKTTEDQFVWIREHFRHPNKTGLVNVFGHTPTQLINKNRSNDVWLSDDEMYIGIDGACAYGGQLNAILISDTGKWIEKYTVKPQTISK